MQLYIFITVQILTYFYTEYLYKFFHLQGGEGRRKAPLNTPLGESTLLLLLLGLLTTFIIIITCARRYCGHASLLVRSDTELHPFVGSARSL